MAPVGAMDGEVCKAGDRVRGGQADVASESGPADGAGAAPTRPFRRKVFYIPGYDPFPPRRYRELYRTEAARQAHHSGYRIEVRAGGATPPADGPPADGLPADGPPADGLPADGPPAAGPPAAGGGAYVWRVDSLIDEARTSAEIEVLTWSDIVRDSMGQGIAATYLQLWRTAVAYIGSGALRRLMRLRKGPMIAALYPIALLLVELMLALAIGGLLGWGLAGAGLYGPLAALAGAGGVWGILALCRRLDRHVYAWYLMHDYAFTVAAGGAYPEALERRMAVFAARIGTALAGDWDEVLVVGHSSGAHVGISVMADLARAGALQSAGPALGLLTLGQVVPMVSFLPGAGRLRGDLAHLSEEAALVWVDITAPGDGCAFALCDPVAVSGMAGPEKRWPLVLSAAFSHSLSPERWRELRWRFFRLHFQYLCAFDRPGPYDYFRVTAGPQTLGQEVAGRQPSKSRIERPLNPFGRVPPR